MADARVNLEDAEDLAALDPGSKPTKSGSQSDEIAQTTVEPTAYNKPGLPTLSTKTAPSPNGKGRGLDPRHANRGRRRRRSSDESIDAVDSKDDSALLVGEEARSYRAVAARLNYLSTDRPDVQYAVKEAARSMAKPCHADWALLTRIGRYLIGRPRVTIQFPWQKRQTQVDGYSVDQIMEPATTGYCIVIGRGGDVRDVPKVLKHQLFNLYESADIEQLMRQYLRYGVLMKALAVYTLCK